MITDEKRNFIEKKIDKKKGECAYDQWGNIKTARQNQLSLDININFFLPGRHKHININLGRALVSSVAVNELNFFFPIKFIYSKLK